ncbi:MAG: PBP1A family penicillin-binding protein [Acidobacteriota bacterium]|nr:PBP1A family penicillin-binding protein [Acidobacteriota bacterium]
MTIEVTSVPDQRRISLRRIPAFLNSLFVRTSTNDRFVFRTVCGLFAILMVVGGDSLLGSYKYYSRIIDARLASGYLTSRPGLYAAPRRIQPGQKLSSPDLLSALRRAGYVESEGSNVWSGTFYEAGSVVEIRPARTNRSLPSVIRVRFERDKTIAELTGDDLPVESFTLEPEVLSNDISSKADKRDSVTFSEIPPVLVHAILSIEDQRFFDHSGLDVFGIARALVRNVGNEGMGQGGSTITQQLVKNTYLTPERTLRRKYAEAMLAFALEQRLTKHDIFALYCNEVYLGQRGAVAVRGVKQAARIYFGKELKELSTAEAAAIAGMIQGPTRYSPVRHAEAARTRRNAVLAAMVRDRWIDNEQAAGILSQPVVVSTGSQFASMAPYFVDFVNRTAESEFEMSPGSRRVYTTIDLDLQQLAERALKRQLDRLDGVYKNRNAKPQAALVALDPKTGNVLAMVGGRDYADSQLNRATDARRQPGSTFKPFVYAAALEDGMSPVQMFADAPREFVYDRNKTYRPANFGGGYSMQDVTMRTALVKSLNVVTVDVALQTGLARIANLSEKFGLPRPERYPSLALGTKEVTPLELAAAYAAFVNGGRRVEPKTITSVGEPPATHSAGDFSSAAEVVSPTTAYMITNMLSAVVDHGTGRAARDVAKVTAVAGKTGTSRDGWFVGYTPNLVCVVWVGFDDNQQLGLTGAEAALPAWAEFIKGSIALRPELGGRNFECPEGIKFVEIDADDGAISTLSCPHRELIAVTERLAPNLECYRHGNLRPDEGITAGRETEIGRQPPVPQYSRRSMRPQTSKSPFLATRVDTTNRRVALVTDMR